jgi:hypothetical protein
MKAAGIFLLSIGLAASLCGCAPNSVNTVDPLRYLNVGRNYDSLEARKQGLKERWLATGY